MPSQTLQITDLGTKSGREPFVAMLEVTITETFLDKAQCCAEMLRELGMHVAIEDSALKTSLYRKTEREGLEPFDEGWPSCCNVLVFPDGSIELEIDSLGVEESVVCDLGTIKDLQKRIGGEERPAQRTSTMRL